MRLANLKQAVSLYAAGLGYEPDDEFDFGRSVLAMKKRGERLLVVLMEGGREESIRNAVSQAHALATGFGLASEIPERKRLMVGLPDSPSVRQMLNRELRELLSTSGIGAFFVTDEPGARVREAVFMESPAALVQ